MPLRAKLLSQQQQQPQSRTMASASSLAHFPPTPADEPEDVVFQSLYGLRTIELNRPKKLNALNGSMIRKIAPRLLEWAKSDMANVIVMKGAGDKAFCAGGDVQQLAKWNQDPAINGRKKSAAYFGQEYKLDHLIATYQKPYIAFMDGITMGGGVGLSIHAPFRIATERTVFAMPETTIGFFPDVGASFFLPRMEGQVGTWLALTSEQLTGANVFYSGVATHYLHSTSLNALESRLAELRFRDYDDLDRRLEVVNATIEEFVTGLPYDEPIAVAGEVRKAIDRCFRFDTVGEIMEALEGEMKNPVTNKWASKTRETMHMRSPTSVHVTLKQMRIGGKWNIASAFKREFGMASKFMGYPDFNEGVTARLVEKRKPKWRPASLEEFASEDRRQLVDSFFLEDGKTKKLELLNDETYSEYPFKNFGVPTEKEVEDKIAEGKVKSKGEVVEYFVREKRQKQGVKEVVSEILSRKTQEGEEGLTWVYEE
ncbi:ClpP/crotonase-like domain-containing protein [Apiosordaria backusii]|uniref:3-hydroxyisobutyryl-CoA hydrolase n=1 Tax=Apiosordaria backusii TaxID=314023 RepID=A0AA40EFJ7_9PEZI|nr:ClpP/crotonase-like domain-containing protein [Apiosordaria backusii]